MSSMEDIFVRTLLDNIDCIFFLLVYAGCNKLYVV